MSARPPYSGRCLCGDVAFEATEEPLTFYACHCTDCQKRAGSAFVLSMWFRRPALRVTKGEAEPRVTAAAPGRPDAKARYCPRCATRLWSEPAKRPDLAVLRPGTLDDVSWFKPIAHLWTRSAQPWVSFPEDARKYETQPADFAELFVLWRSRPR